MNFQEFADTRGLTLESVMVPFRPDDDWDKTTTHYAGRPARRLQHPLWECEE